jgi:predicted nucleic acid-binding Zn ribbon protein
MERALKTIVKLRLSQDPEAREKLACRAWPLAVGKKVANHTRPLRMVRGTLLVEVEDALWQRQLFTLRHQILARLSATIGSALIEDVEFRIGAPRRMPAREERSAQPQAALWDEAEGISDPALRRVYQISRRKALA